MQNEMFKTLNYDEQMEIEGGLFGVDDAVIITTFLAAAAIGAAIGCNRKNRE